MKGSNILGPDRGSLIKQKVFTPSFFGSGFVQKCRIRKYTFDEDDGTWSDLISMAILDEEWDRQRGVKVSRQVEAR